MPLFTTYMVMSKNFCCMVHSFLHQISSYQMETCFIVTNDKFLYLNCNRKFKQNFITTNLSFFANYCTNVFHTHGNTEFILCLNLLCVSVLFNHQIIYYINGLSASTDKLSSHNIILPIQITVLLNKPCPVGIYWLQVFLPVNRLTEWYYCAAHSQVQTVGWFCY